MICYEYNGWCAESSVADQLQRLNEEYHDAYVAGGLASADVSGA